ncbi:MAG: hypothetical protein QOK10_3483 [Pseudonocardiales bacterium]|jgi:hypothetical protein|nr:hypothetical protein [Pseudonocardiales bacterium]
MDNWIASQLPTRLRACEAPLVIDLGYGQSPVTTIELLSRLRPVRADVQVLGLEIDAGRVAAAKPAEAAGLRFERGGFELAGHQPVIVRAANVLRQYPESSVPGHWSTMQRQLQPGGVIVEGTCDELGRRGTWVLLDAERPLSLTLSCRLDVLDRPSDLADRLVKALIHRNVRGERIHQLLNDLDRAWDLHAPLAAFGPRQRWQAMVRSVSDSWPVLDTPSRHRFGELTIAWDAVCPAA